VLSSRVSIQPALQGSPQSGEEKLWMEGVTLTEQDPLAVQRVLCGSGLLRAPDQHWELSRGRSTECLLKRYEVFQSLCFLFLL